MSSAKEFGEYVGECIVRAESAKTDLERDLFLKGPRHDWRPRLSPTALRPDQPLGLSRRATNRPPLFI